MNQKNIKKICANMTLDANVKLPYAMDGFDPHLDFKNRVFLDIIIMLTH